ncbi:hypothetical protein BDV30DRAFT_236815 [Aspergillus minisclerotigenes]|uniref:Uncharacterized protein n=1 Tax=Aspergillus minisclerotigenes TaxID=656917 RepID=A0A5N6JBN0_9EURO|nr:hypothetical protein BDV30DRAFT_236815 [Aspergillus minisclerotigenes]
MEPLPPDSAVMRGSPCHYPQWQLEVPLHEGSIVPRPTVNYDVEMGPILRMSTSFHSDQIATVGYSSGHLPSNTPLTLPTLPVEPQYMRVQQETRANNNRERYVEGTSNLRRDVDGRAVHPQGASTARPTFCGMLDTSILLLSLTSAMSTAA